MLMPAQRPLQVTGHALICSTGRASVSWALRSSTLSGVLLLCNVFVLHDHDMLSHFSCSHICSHHIYTMEHYRRHYCSPDIHALDRYLCSGHRLCKMKTICRTRHNNCNALSGQKLWLDQPQTLSCQVRPFCHSVIKSMTNVSCCDRKVFSFL